MNIAKVKLGVIIKHQHPIFPPTKKNADIITKDNNVSIDQFSIKQT